MKPRHLVILPIVSLLVAASADGANFYWDSDTITAENQNGSGIWTSAITNTNWESASTAGVDSQVSWVNDAGNTAFIGNASGTGYTNASTGGTITLGENVTAFSLSMSSGQLGSYIIEPGSSAYTLTSASIGNNNTTANLTVNAVVAGTTINKINAGKVILNGANIFNGAVTVTAGTLSYSIAGLTSAANGLGQSSNIAANLKLASGTVLQYTGSGGTTDRLFTINASVAAGSATLDASGSGAINFNNTGSIAYGTAGQTRTLNLAGTNTGSNILAATIVDNGVGSAVSLNKSGTGTWVLTGTANIYTGNTTISAGALDVGTISSGALSNSGLLFSGGVLQGNGSFTRTFSNTASAAAGQLSGSSGGFAAKGGALTINFGGSGALVQLSGPSNRLGTNLIFGSATADSKVTVVNPLDLNNSTRLITVNSGAGGDSAELSGVVSNTGILAATFALMKAGTGTLILSNANTYTSSTAVTAGTLQIGNAKALGFGGVQMTTATTGTTVSSGATLDLNGTTGVNEPIILSGTGVGGNGALINNSGNAASIGSGLAGLTLGSGGSGYSSAPVVTIGGTGSGATATATLGVTASSFSITGTTTYSTAPTVTITGGAGVAATATAVLTGGVVTGVTITNPGTAFTNAPTITFSGGTVLVAATNPTGTGNATSFTVAGVQMTSAGSGYTGTPTYTIDSGNATAGAIGLSSVTLAADSSIGGSGDTTIHAVVSESGGARVLTKIGAGNLTLTGANTYTGGTALTGGKLVLSHNSAAGTAGIVVSGGSTTLDISSGITIANNVTVSNATASVVHGIAAAGSYNVGTSGVLKSSFATATPDTTAKILAGTSSGGSTLTMSFSGSSLATNDGVRRTDVFSVGGTGSDLYVLQLSASGLAPDSVLGYNNGSIWDLAVTGNTGNNATLAQQNYAGAFSAFQADNANGYVLGNYVGAYGIDTTTNSLWAVVNYGGSFSAVPEPTSALAGLLIGAGLLRRRRA